MISSDSTQSAAAKRLGYSAGLISQVLRKTYPGNVNAVEEAVRVTRQETPEAHPLPEAAA